MKARILIYLAILIGVYSTTYGWKFWVNAPDSLTYAQKQMSERLFTHIEHLAVQIGDRNLEREKQLLLAQDYITKQLESFGYVVVYDEFNVGQKSARNIVASKLAQSKSNKIIVVGAHYDTCYNPGADDNASGVAGLLEIARSLADVNTKQTINFVFFTNEEPPFFKTESMGSRVYAQRLKQQGIEVTAMLSLEMIGYYSSEWFSQKYPPLLGVVFPNKANFISVVGNRESGDLVNRVSRLFKRNSVFPIASVSLPEYIQGVSWSDHWSFWQEGYPAVMVTDTSYLRSKHYHHSSDLPDTLDYKSMALVVDGLKNVVTELSKAFE